MGPDGQAYHSRISGKQRFRGNGWIYDIKFDDGMEVPVLTPHLSERLLQRVRDVQAWRQSNDIRLYIEAVRRAAIEKYGEISPDGDVGRWILWAIKRADLLDPLSGLSEPQNAV